MKRPGLINQSAATQSTVEAVEIDAELANEHAHNVERWWGALGAPDETNAIAATVTVPFAATSGNNTWGTAIPICGTDDVPVLAAMTTFDPHRVLVIDLDAQVDAWRLRFIYGSGTSGDAITAGQWSEIVLIANSALGIVAGGFASDIKMIPLPIGTKLWAQVWNDTNGEIMTFYWGVHGYSAPSFP